MAVANKKRPHDHVQTAEARKRQRNLKKNAAKTQSQSLENLSWKTVTLPDRLDDYEGFFGLDEVDGVNVIKYGDGGKVVFVSNNINKHAERPLNHDVKPHDNEPEWSGFDDEPMEAVTHGDNKSEAGSLPTLTKSVLSKAKSKPQPKQPASAPSTVAGGAFTGLEDESEAVHVDVSAWKSLRLSPDTLASLAKIGFGAPTAIQHASVPIILDGHDVIGKASTGSGKTLAYGIPILEKCLESAKRPANQPQAPKALILSPTRELAHQISTHLTNLCSGLVTNPPKVATVTGGLSLQKQQRLLKDADIVVGTPGRLWEVISGGHGTIDAVKKIQFLVVDEADRLLSEGHFKEVEEILTALDRIEETNDGEDDAVRMRSAQHERQTLVFSATFDKGLQRKLTGKSRPENNLLSNKASMEYLVTKLNFRTEPKFIDVNPVRQLATGLKEGLIECPAGTDKDLYLYATLLLNSNTRTLVFVNSVAAVRRLTPYLQNLDLPALALHSGMAQKARLRSVERFSDASKASVLVATDVAARGLDIPDIQLVIHYHLPRAADMYVHRSGRTARAGQSGSSILICAPEEVAGVRRLVAKVHAQSAVQSGDDAADAARQGFYIRTLDIDRKVVTRLKPRSTLAKKLADTTIAQEKGRKEDDFLRKAAEELGVDYSSEEFEQQAKGKRGRGAGRAKKEKEAKALTKGEVAGLRAELRALLKERVNVGVSEKYITNGRVDVEELLRQQETGGDKTGEFLGSVGMLGMDE